MRLILMFTLLGLAQLDLSAQSEQTLFNRAKVRGAFGGTFFTIGQAKGHEVTGAGGGGGLVFNQTMIGAFGHGEVFTIDRPGEANSILALGYGGLWLGYSMPTSKAIHGFASLKIGPGRVRVDKWGDWWTNDPGFDFSDDAVLTVSPEVGLEVNVFHWMRMTGTVAYRYVNGFDGALGLDKNDLNAPYFGLGFRFGWFGHRKSNPDVPKG